MFLALAGAALATGGALPGALAGAAAHLAPGALPGALAGADAAHLAVGAKKNAFATGGALPQPLAAALPGAAALAAAALAAALATVAFFLFASCESFLAIGFVDGTVSALPSSSFNIPPNPQQPENALDMLLATYVAQGT